MQILLLYYNMQIGKDQDHHTDFLEVALIGLLQYTTQKKWGNTT